MFTGIISATGTIRALTPKAGGVTIEVTSDTFDFNEIALGDSIALNGCCLTVVAQANRVLSFDVSPETLSKTTGFAAGDHVNMEKAMRLSDRLGGHLVSGHVDGVGRIVKLQAIASATDEHNYLLEIEVPEELVRFIAPKGSLTLHGVSLTTNTINGNRVAINLIPHTFANTVFHTMQVGDPINVEVDLLARYIAQLLR